MHESVTTCPIPLCRPWVVCSIGPIHNITVSFLFTRIETVLAILGLLSISLVLKIIRGAAMGVGVGGGGGAWGAFEPPFVSFFKQTTYNGLRKRHDNLVNTLSLTYCDPLFIKNSRSLTPDP